MRGLLSRFAQLSALATAGLAAVWLFTAPSLSYAEDAYPSRTVRLVVPFPPGGSTDLTARIVAEELSKSLGQPVVVENRPGAGGSVGTELAARAEPDGYTLLLGGVTNVILAVYQKNLSYDPIGAFQPIAEIADIPNVLVVAADSPFKTLDDLVMAAKVDPGKLTYGSAGPGSAAHLVCALFASRAGIDMTHVPYRGNAPATTDLMGGQIPAMCNNLAGTLPYTKGGKLRLLAVTGTRRSPFAPEVPTFGEYGLQGMDSGAWMGLLAPAGTPKAVVDTLAARVKDAVARPEARQQIEALGAEPLDGSPATYAARVERERRIWAEVVEGLGEKLD